jgi:hypothetical protein
MISRQKADDRVLFRALIDRSVLAAVGEAVTSLAGLLRYLPSVYPTELLASLARLGDCGAVNSAIVDKVRDQASTRPIEPPQGRSLLPLPHPLDFEWRFMPRASRDLLNIANDLTPLYADVLLFGTPGLAVEALSLPTNRRLSFLGEDNLVTRRLIALNRATGSALSIAFCSAGLPRNSCDAVVLDPPWYMDFIRPMLAAAAAACRADGVVLASLPPLGTRPSAESDRDAAVRFAGRLGLDLIDYLPLAIGYDTPFFETNALAAAGVFAPSQWRRGDLIIFRKSRRPTRPISALRGRRREWIETSIGRMRLFIKPEQSPTTGLEGLIPTIDGDILPSVSRRDPRRRGTQVWTSGNRAFRTDNANLVLQAALSRSGKHIQRGAQPSLWGNVYERDAVQRIGDMLMELAVREAGEERGSHPVALERSIPWTSSLTSSYSKLRATASG